MFFVTTNCVEIDECATNNGGCSLNADCVNTNGSFNCSCRSGFYGDGFVCVGKRGTIICQSLVRKFEKINGKWPYLCMTNTGLSNGGMFRSARGVPIRKNVKTPR